MSDQDEVELELHEALRRAGVYGTQSISAATMEVMATLRDLGIVGNGAALRAKLAEQTERAELHEALRRAGVYGTQSISAATMEVMATLRDLGIVGNGADLRAKLAAANEELSAIDAAMDKVDLPTRQDDWALTRVGRLLSLQDWWKDYAECTQKAVERAEAAERERDAALAEAAGLRKACMAALEPAGDAPDEVRAQLRAALATPSTAGERIETDIFSARIRRGVGCIGVPEKHYAAMLKVCHVAEDNRRIEYPRELIEALDELAALEKGNG